MEHDPYGVHNGVHNIGIHNGVQKGVHNSVHKGVNNGGVVERIFGRDRALSEQIGGGGERERAGRGGGERETQGDGGQSEDR
jgi:hypothetical protein